MTELANRMAGSSSATTTSTTTRESDPILHLRPVADQTSEKSNSKSKSKVRWTEDVVDNEHMNKKKTKICCIFHPQREFGESSSDESSDSSSDSSGSSDGSDGEFDGGNNNEGNENSENDEQKHECCNHNHKKKKKKKISRPSSPNAYESQPAYKNKSKLPEKVNE